MILLRLITWQYVRKHLLRTLLTIAGIVLGVAVFVGMHTANQSVLFAFYKTVDQIAGVTQLQISAGETGFPEDVLERVQAVSEVKVAVPVIEATVQAPNNVLILGIDMTGDRSLRSYDLETGDQAVIEDPLVFLAQPDSIMITRTFAEENHLGINSKLPMKTMDGEKQFTVRGIMKSGGLASAFGGNLAIMDIYAAQKVFGRGRTFDRIDLAVQDGLRPEDVRKKLEALLGPGYQVESPQSRGQQFESLSRVYAMSANITSLFALFIGMFIIYNTFSIAVAQRRNEIGILRALGATRGQIRNLFLMESAVLGLAGSVIGILFGILIARGMAGYIGGLLGEIYGVAQKTEELTTNPVLLGGALAIGVLTSLIAAVIPARNAATVDPIQALQKGRFQFLTEHETRIRRVLALVLIGLSVWCVISNHFFYAGYFFAVVAGLLLVPTFALWIARAIRPLLKLVHPVEGTLAADSLIQAPRRTSGTVAALMLSLGLVISLAGVARASYSSIMDWLRVALNPDLFVTTSESLTKRSFRFPGSMEQEIRAIPGVGDVQGARTARILIDGKPIMMVAVDVRDVGRHVKLPSVAGKQEEMYRRTANQEGVMVSENFSLLHGYRYGDVLKLNAPAGEAKLPIVGVVADYSDQQGSILIDRALYRKYWRDDTLNVLRVYAKDDPAAVRGRILAKYTGNRRIFVLSNAEVKAYILRLTDQWFGLTYVQIAVAVLVAILGIVNTLTVSITDRRRELGVLQAIGGLRWQIRKTIWLEALCIGTVGLVLGLIVGAAQLYYSLEIARRDLAGIRLNYEYPVNIALVLVPVILGSAFLSAIGPAESAVRGNLVEALEYE